MVAGRSATAAGVPVCRLLLPLGSLVWAQPQHQLRSSLRPSLRLRPRPDNHGRRRTGAGLEPASSAMRALPLTAV